MTGSWLSDLSATSSKFNSSSPISFDLFASGVSATELHARGYPTPGSPQVLPFQSNLCFLGCCLPSNSYLLELTVRSTSHASHEHKSNVQCSDKPVVWLSESQQPPTHTGINTNRNQTCFSGTSFVTHVVHSCFTHSKWETLENTRQLQTRMHLPSQDLDLV